MMKPIAMKQILHGLVVMLGALCLGCGSADKSPLVPSASLTAEQQEKVRQEDQFTEEEESGVNNPARQMGAG
jgi:hypothetical protein